MARLRRHGGVPLDVPREQTGQLVKPERLHGSRGRFQPTGTRHTDPTVTPQYEPLRNGLPPLVPYQWRRRRYPHAERALALAEARYGKRPATLRGINPNKKPRRRQTVAA